jgi:hypothetical protein
MQIEVMHRREINVEQIGLFWTKYIIVLSPEMKCFHE